MNQDSYALLGARVEIKGNKRQESKTKLTKLKAKVGNQSRRPGKKGLG